MHAALSERFCPKRSQPIRAAAHCAISRLIAARKQSDGPRTRPLVEPVESRVLLSAYSLDTLGYFGANQVGANPNSPLVQDSGGNLYGTTLNGGACGLGTIFEIASGTTSATTVASFTGTNGALPSGTLAIDAAGNLFGSTQQGGTGGYGTAFELPQGSSAITSLASFNSANGSKPVGVVLDAAGNLYGATQTGGTGNEGAVFEIGKGSAAITTIASFNNTNGNSPDGVTLDSAGNLYGTASQGGTYGDGTVFEIARGSNAITTLVNFNTDTTGDLPGAGLTVDGSGNLFGTTEDGGENFSGSIFEIPSGSTTLTTLASFNTTNGEFPNTVLTLDGSGNLFGSTMSGGTGNDGVVFELPKGASSVADLVSFNGTNGSGPSAIILDASGNLYGNTAGGGSAGFGTSFEIAAGSGALTTLASFSGVDGYNSVAPVVQDSSGNLFGATLFGGTYNHGTVYEIAQGTSAITTIASFTASSQSPVYGLTIDPYGNLYGAMPFGGASSLGAIFEIAKGTNSITQLASFDGTDGAAPGALTLDASGNLFGTTGGGGASTDGTVFELPAGSSTVTALASFNGTNGKEPQAPLTLDSSGDLLGTTSYGGAYNDGTVFELPAGSSTITDIASFNGTDGTDPLSQVTFDLAGNIWGTTHAGGSKSDGTVFKIAKGSNAITTVVNFTGTNGSAPSAGLTIDPYGNLFGTTNLGGSGSRGTVFEIPEGSLALTTLFSFTANGKNPTGQLAVDEAGDLFGTTEYGGPGVTTGSGEGTVFELAPAATYPAYISASSGTVYHYDATSGDLTLYSGALTFNADSTDEPLTNITADGATSSVVFDTSEHLAGITLLGGAQATVQSLGSARTHSNHNVLVIGTLGSVTDPTFSIDPISKLDLTDNDLIIHTGSADTGTTDVQGNMETSELKAIEALAAMGRNVAPGGIYNGNWTGNGLTSSAAATADDSANAGYEQNILAVEQNSDMYLGGYSSWTVGSFSETLGANDIIVKYTYNGDLNLDGAVDGNAATIFSTFYDNGATSGNTYAYGDLNGDGKIDGNDATIFSTVYGNGLAGSGLPQL